MIILSRQARDKHRESTQKRVAFSCRLAMLLEKMAVRGNMIQFCFLNTSLVVTSSQLAFIKLKLGDFSKTGSGQTRTENKGTDQKEDGWRCTQGSAAIVKLERKHGKQIHFDIPPELSSQPSLVGPSGMVAASPGGAASANGAGAMGGGSPERSTDRIDRAVLAPSSESFRRNLTTMY
jgi:hypothetical protein